MKHRRGFLLPAGFYWIVGGIIYTAALGWAFIADLACGDCAGQGTRWF